MDVLNKYTYTAIVKEVYDGDTATVDIDLGMKVWIHGEKLRLARINAPEMKGAEKPMGEISRDYLRSIVLGKEVTLKTIKDRQEKYGRYLAEIWIDGKNVNDLLVSSGHAKYQEY